MFNDLSQYLQVDREKQRMIDDMMPKVSAPVIFHSKIKYGASDDFADYSLCEDIKMDRLPFTKYCPQCHRKYPEEENFCFDCLVKLKNISEITKVCDIKTKPEFKFKGTNDYVAFEEIFTPENAEKINDFKFALKDYKGIVKDIKRTAFLEFDNLVKSNELVLDYLDILDKVLLFSKSFVEVDYKSYGQELGIFAFDRIEIDDRQLPGLQITTLIHELSHFLLKEILAHVICNILDCNKNSSIDAISTFILTYSPLNRLIDEYSAHSVEGRFAIYGYQDYSSFLQIQKSLEGEMPSDEIEIAKSIGNTFSLSIKEILESYLDDDLREDIKVQFREDVFDGPKYEMLAMENCNKLKSRGFMQAIWLIISEGFEVAGMNIEKLEEYKKNF